MDCLKHSSQLAGLCIAALALGCAAPAAQPDLARARAEVAQASIAFSKAETSGRPDSALAFMWDDAVLHPPGQPALTSHDAIRAFYGPVKLSEAPADSTPARELRTITVSAGGDMAVEWGPGAIVVEPPGARPMLVRFKFVSMWERRNGQWKLRFNGWNADTPAS